MPNPSRQGAGRASRRERPRLRSRILALTALALPLVALAPAPAGVVGAAASEQQAITPQVVTVVDGMTLHLGVTDARTVEGALRALDVPRGLLDRVEPALHASLDPSTVIRIARVEMVHEQVQVALPREVVRIEDPSLLRGYAQVDRPGRNGVRIETHLVLTVDGEEESRLIVASETLREPRARIERIGTGMREGETVWDALARCEASGRWDAVRTIGGRIAYSGGLQFAPRTWAAFRPDGMPAMAHEASREQQILVAERVLERQGWGAWPACSRRLGLR